MDLTNATPTELGKYQIRGVLGRGAMGTVYDGWDPVIGRRVAIKTVPLLDDADPEALEGLERFKREAQAAGRLSHPNIVGVYDYGETNETAYIVMEFIEGQSLKQRLDARERFPVAETVRIMEQVLAGLQFSHDSGVIHRDIKPGNVMLAKGGRVKLADFGIARIESSVMTQDGTMLGTPAYMSPEQLMAQSVDARSDLYSAGVMLYQLLTGERPFEGGLTAIIHKALNTTPPRPSELSVTAPVNLDAVVARAMARRPADRFPDADSFSRALRTAFEAPEGAAPSLEPEENDEATLVSRAPPPAPPVAPPESDAENATLVSRPTPAAIAPAPAAAVPAAAAGVGKPGGGSKIGLFGGIAAVVLALAGGGAWLALRPSPPASVPESAPVSTPVPAPSAPAKVAPAETPHAITPHAITPLAPIPQAVPTTPAPSASAPAAPAPAAPTSPAPTLTPTRPTAETPTAPPTSKPVTTSAPAVGPSQATAPLAPAAQTPAKPASEATPSTPATPAAVPAPAASLPAVPAPASPSPSAVPAPPTVAAIEPPNPAAIRNALAALAASASCAVPHFSVADDGSVGATGIVGSGAPAAALHDEVEKAVGPAQLSWLMRPVDGPYCDAFDIIRPIAQASGPAFGLTLKNDVTRLLDNQPIRPILKLPPFPAHLVVDYLSHDGSVTHLFPVEGSREKALPANATLTLGDAKQGVGLVGPPFGTDVILAVASSVPLFAKPRPSMEETAQTYLPALQAALDAAKRANANVVGRVLALDTAEK